MTTRDRDYQRMMTALADVAKRRDAALESAEQAYQQYAAQAAGELARAETDAASADSWAGTAAAQVDDVDREASRLWGELRRVPGMRARALGELPAPVEPARAALSRTDSGTVVPAPRQSASVLLARAAGRIDDRARPPLRRRLPRWALAILPLVGALSSGLTGLLAAGLVDFGGQDVPAAAVITGAGWLGFAVAPSAGVPVAALFAHRRHARLGIRGIGLTLLGGMASATALALTFTASR